LVCDFLLRHNNFDFFGLLTPQQDTRVAGQVNEN